MRCLSLTLVGLALLLSAMCPRAAAAEFSSSGEDSSVESTFASSAESSIGSSAAMSASKGSTSAAEFSSSGEDSSSTTAAVQGSSSSMAASSAASSDATSDVSSSESSPASAAVPTGSSSMAATSAASAPGSGSASKAASSTSSGTSSGSGSTTPPPKEKKSDIFTVQLNSTNTTNNTKAQLEQAVRQKMRSLFPGMPYLSVVFVIVPGAPKGSISFYIREDGSRTAAAIKALIEAANGNKTQQEKLGFRTISSSPQKGEDEPKKGKLTTAAVAGIAVGAVVVLVLVIVIACKATSSNKGTGQSGELLNNPDNLRSMNMDEELSPSRQRLIDNRHDNGTV